MKISRMSKITTLAHTRIDFNTLVTPSTKEEKVKTCLQCKIRYIPKYVNRCIGFCSADCSKRFKGIGRYKDMSPIWK